MKHFFPVLLAIFCWPWACAAQTKTTEIFIVRHADRLGTADELTPLGMERAQELKRVLGLSKIDSIYSTDFTRTKKTAMPLAASRRMSIRLYSNIPQLIKQITTKGAGKRILIVGHSDTVDDLIKQCGCVPPADIDPQMPGTQYDNLFLVTMQKSSGLPKLQCEVIRMKYGKVTN